MSSLENIPDSVLAEYPLTMPPPGVVSNFVNPPTSGTTFIIVGGVLLPIMLIFVAIRIYSKLKIIRQTTWDDLTCSIAAVGTVLQYICVSLAITKKNYGRHAWDVSVLQSIRPWFAVPVYIMNWSATLILPFAKITFFIFYLQIFRPFKWLRSLCYVGIAFTAITFLGLLIGQLAFATPHPGETWLQLDTDPRELKSLKDLSLPITAISFFIDIYTFVLPMMGVAKLKLSPRRKFGVVLVFLTGLGACISSFLSLYYKIGLNDRTTDTTWASIPVNIAIFAELTVGVTASCMPSFAKFTRHNFPNLSVIDSAITLKDHLYKTRLSRSSKASALASRLRKDLFQKLSVNESDRNLKKPGGALIDMHDLELGNSARTTNTYIDSSGVVDKDPSKGIHIQHGWVQTSQEMLTEAEDRTTSTNTRL